MASSHTLLMQLLHFFKKNIYITDKKANDIYGFSLITVEIVLNKIPFKSEKIP